MDTEKQKYFVQASYIGKGYSGWQSQKNGKSIQEQIELALAKIYKHPITIHGCGRTDTGVHATNYVFHVVLPKTLPPYILHKANNALPTQIALHKFVPVDAKANAQLSAEMRAYTYYVHFTKNPYLNSFSTYYFVKNMDVKKLKEAASFVVGKHDFRNFCLEPDKHKSTICTLSQVEVFQHEGRNQLAIRFFGDHYLRSMIRLLVGELLEVGKGNTSVADFKRYIDVQEKKPKSHKAHANGLHLTAVHYPFFKPEIPHPFA